MIGGWKTEEVGRLGEGNWRWRGGRRRHGGTVAVGKSSVALHVSSHDLVTAGRAWVLADEYRGSSSSLV